MGKDRRRDFIKANKPSTSNSIDKLTYCPKKHKQKFVKKLRQQLQSRSKEVRVRENRPVRDLKFGSWNLDGIEAGTLETLDNMIRQEDLDVSHFIKVFER